MLKDIHIRNDLRPGDLGRLIALHGTAYEGEHGHFGLKFEALVAETVAEFIRNGAKGRVFLAERGDQLVGCAAMVERMGGRGQLRWVLVAPEARGLGLGKKLVNDAIDFARESGWSEVFLITTEGLDASMDIYRKLGFAETRREKDPEWFGDADVITMALALA